MAGLQPGRRGGGYAPGAGGTPGGAYTGNFDFGGGGMDDFLSSLFGGAQGGGTPGGFGGFSRPERRGAQAGRRPEAEYPIEIGLEEAFRGTSKSFTLSLPQTCDTCGGSGAVSVGKSKSCPMCSGTGKVKGGRGFFGNNTCPQCAGTGQAVEVCPQCHGDGTMTKQKRLSDVKIPAGVADGQRIRLAGQGANGDDLFLKVRVRPHPQFERQGDELRTEFTVPYTVAALGGEATVETFGGRKVLNVPAGTQSGQSFRLTGQGMPRLKGAGRATCTRRPKSPCPRTCLRASATC